MDAIDEIFAATARRRYRYFPVIACLYTGGSMPLSCAPMPRWPEFVVGMVLDDRFADHLAAAIAQNSAIHDGAVMIGRDDEKAPYTIRGWSYRLYPPPAARQVEINRGAAFNSCMEMSLVQDIDRLYVISTTALLRFERGIVRQLAHDAAMRNQAV
jgi:hypothetical protein